MNNRLNDDSLKVVISFLFAEFCKAAGRGVYLFFPAEKIEIIGRNQVRFEAKEKAGSLRQGLRDFGVTLYQLHTGKSEYNCESYQLDGYPPVESRYWPAIEHLLSGNAYNLPEAKRTLGILTPSQWLKFAAIYAGANVYSGLRTAAVSALSVIEYLALRIARKLRQAAIRSWPIIKKKIEDYFSQILTILMVQFLAAMIFFAVYNYYRNLGLLLIVMIPALASVIVMFLYLDSDHRISDNRKCAYMSVLLEFLAIALIGLSFTTMTFGVQYDTVIVERSTGGFVARLPLHLGGDFKVWPGYFINLFKYRPTPGLPLSGNLAMELNANLPFTIQYQVRPDKYEDAWQKWKNRQVLEAAINLQMIHLVAVLNKRLDYLQIPDVKDYKVNVELQGDLDPKLAESIKSKAVSVITGDLENAVSGIRYEKLISRMPEVLGVINELIANSPLAEFLVFNIFTVIDNKTVVAAAPGAGGEDREQYPD